MRLIDADNAIHALGVFSDMEHGNKHFLNGINSAKKIINECVTIDAVPVVRGEWRRGVLRVSIYAIDFDIKDSLRKEMEAHHE